MSEREQYDLHVLILQRLRLKGDMGRTEEMLLNDARRDGGFDLDLAGLQAELRLLADTHRWIIAMPVDLGAKRWCITSVGKMKLAEHGL